jgi:hypothetical protein
MKEAPGSSETSVLTRATRRNNTEDTILHSHRRENLKSYEILSIYLIHSAALGREIYSASNRNEYQNQKNNASGK